MNVGLILIFGPRLKSSAKITQSCLAHYRREKIPLPPEGMAKTPCTPSSVSPRRRPRWPEYQNDNDPFEDRDTPAWPTVAPHAAPQVEKAEAAPHAPLVSQEALADRLGVSVATLARQRKKGRLL